MKSCLQCFLFVSINVVFVMHCVLPVFAQEERRSEALLPFWAADTSRTEYAGIYSHFSIGGISTRFQDYPNINIGSLTTIPVRSSVQSLAFGLNTDSPLRFPFLTRRQNNDWFKGIRFGMQIEAQLTDISILDSTSEFVRGGMMQSGTTLRAVFASLRSVAVIPSLRYSLASGLTLQAGMRLGITNNSYIRLSDSILPNAAFPNGSRERDALENSPIPDYRADELSVVVGIGYNLQADKILLIRPEIMLSVPLVRQAAWKPGLPSVRFGMSALFNTQKIIPVPDTTYNRDTTLQMVGYTQKPNLHLVSRNVEVRSAEYPEEPPSVVIRESYRREIPKPKPLLTASIDAEFAFISPKISTLSRGSAQSNVDDRPFQRSLVLQAEKTALTLTPLCSNATNASVYALALQEYFNEQGMSLKILQSSTASMLTDTTILVAALPHIRFTPRIVSEVPLRGTRLQIFRQLTNTKRILLMTFVDSTEAERDTPKIWNPAQMPDVLMNPSERLMYVFTVIDESGLEMLADSGNITLRTEPITGNLGLKRVVEVYAFEQELPLADFMRSIVNINTAKAERVNIVPPADTTNGTETALRLQLLERTLPKAERTSLTFLPPVAALTEPNILPTAQNQEHTKKMRDVMSRMMLVFVERRL
jgi:hypothetical protein